MRVRKLAEQPTTLAQVVRDLVRDIAGISALEPAEPRYEVRILVDGHDDRRLLALAQGKVLGSATGSDVDDAGSFRLADLIPLDDLVGRCRLRTCR